MSDALGPLLVDVGGTRLSRADAELLRHPAVGGAILFTRNYADRAQLTELVAAMRSARPNLLVTADHEGGRVQRFRDGFTRIAPMRALGRLAARDPEAAGTAAREIGWLLAAEITTVGIDMPLAPVVDLDYGASAVIGDRAFSDAAETTARLARAFAAGLRDAGSAATAKHFPGHGFVAADSHEQLPVDARDPKAIAADMQPYHALVGDGLESVMMAHVRYPQVDALPASLSPRWIGGCLRGDIGFDGCVFCDDLGMAGAAAFGDHRERLRLALAAGCDYLPVCNDRDAVLALLDDAARGDDENARVRRERLAAACRRPAAADAHGARRAAAIESNARLARDWSA